MLNDDDGRKIKPQDDLPVHVHGKDRPVSVYTPFQTSLDVSVAGRSDHCRYAGFLQVTGNVQ